MCQYDETASPDFDCNVVADFLSNCHLLNTEKAICPESEGCIIVSHAEDDISEYQGWQAGPFQVLVLIDGAAFVTLAVQVKVTTTRTAH